MAGDVNERRRVLLSTTGGAAGNDDAHLSGGDGNAVGCGSSDEVIGQGLKINRVLHVRAAGR